MSAETIDSDAKDGGITREDRNPGVDEEQAASYESARKGLEGGASFTRQKHI